MQQLEQRIDLVNCAGRSHQEVGWVGREDGGAVGGIAVTRRPRERQ